MYQTHLSDQGGVADAFGAQTDHIEDEAEEAVASSSLAGKDCKEESVGCVGIC